MKRRSFFKNATLALAGAAVTSPVDLIASSARRKSSGIEKPAKNIIFLVSDGMSIGTLTMADMLLQRMEGKQSNWLSLYQKGLVTRALMETASANSLVTDSAAASSSWGGGVRVNNGSLNINPDGSFNKPILQKFKSAGKAVGCVTSVPITHATPAGFCVNVASRGSQSKIAEQYLALEFDVLMGGGTEFFSPQMREDKVDLFKKFSQKNYEVLRNKSDLMRLSSSGKPLLGVFHTDGLPYTVDINSSESIKREVPTLAQMTKAAITKLKNHKDGFVLQIEGGSVDWAAHANDSAALLHEQLAFDAALGEAMSFAETDKETLVIITTDHGNANPGLFGGDAQFDKIQHFKQSNHWVLNAIKPGHSARSVIEQIEHAQGIVLKTDEATELLKHYAKLDGGGLYNPSKLPYKTYAQILTSYTGIGFGSTGHSGDLVELAMYGPGSENLKPIVKNYELHNFMLEAAEMPVNA